MKNVFNSILCMQIEDQQRCNKKNMPSVPYMMQMREYFYFSPEPQENCTKINKIV